MSISDVDESELFVYSRKDPWNSSMESMITQKVTKLTKSDSMFKIPTVFDSSFALSELELREVSVETQPFTAQWEFKKKTTEIPTIINTKSILRDELDMLRINLSTNDKNLCLRGSQFLRDLKVAKKRKHKKLLNLCKKPASVCQKMGPRKVRDLLTEIEASESAKRDTVIWKFLKRGSLPRKELINTKKFLLEVQALQSIDSRIQNSQPVRVTCPNCRFFVTTNVKKVSSVRTKFVSLFMNVFGICALPYVIYALKDTVHICPLCNIYLGFSPAFGIRFRKRVKRSLAKQNQNLSRYEIKIPETEDIMLGKLFETKKMVSASSTSAKNLFVESKIRLSDRVQVNVNNIAAVARQIQRGSKSNENLMTAAKNFALQEAAIENSETNLKKLKLLATHIHNQLDSLHNSSTKMEVVLEQVRSMQR